MEKLKTLKEAREAIGLSQQALSQCSNVPTVYLSQAEAGTRELSLENMILLEQQLGERIDWGDDLTPYDKAQVLRIIVSLADHFPLAPVLEAGAKTVADKTIKAPIALLTNYASAAVEQEPLLPPDVQNNMRRRRK